MPPTHPGKTVDYADGRRFRILPSRPETRRHKNHKEITKVLSMFSSLIESQRRPLRRSTEQSISGIPGTKWFLRESLVSFVSLW